MSQAYEARVELFHSAAERPTRRQGPPLRAILLRESLSSRLSAVQAYTAAV